MANFNMETELLESKYLSKNDVDTQGVDVTIAGITREEVGQEQDTKFILYFKEGFCKPMVLNKTNTRVLVALHGANTDNWLGKKCNVYLDPNVGFGGQITGGCRVRAATPAPVPGKMTRAELLAAAANFPEEDDLP